jgi:hypothetical protein
MMNTSPDAFAAWENDPEKADAYESARQAIKPVTFGVPGSLGASSLASYAQRSYGVSMTIEEARERRQRLISEVYPELTDYLAEDVHAVLANTLHTAVDVVRLELGKTHLSCVRKVLEGEPKRTDGVPYKAQFVERVWTGLNRANKHPELIDDLQKRNTSKELARKVTQAGVATLTGRARGRVRYSQARNTPFQGLASDGAALAMFTLVKEGFRVIGFVHDEVLVELPDEGGFVSKAAVDRVEQIMIAEMEKVLGGLPAGVKSTLSTRWSKKAKRIVQGDRVLPWSPPEEPPPLSVAAEEDVHVRNGACATSLLPLAAPVRNSSDGAVGMERLIDFIVERHAIYERRRAGQPKPWTADPILQQFRFCNVYRERDTETRWIAENWRQPHADDPDLWFALVVARLVNWHESLAALGYPAPWCPEHFVAVLEERQKRGEKVFTGAYIVPAAKHLAGSKVAYLAQEILTPLWEGRARLRHMVHGTLAHAHALLMDRRGLGSFLAGQVIADLKYVPPLSQAPDWWAWAASGPGSRRGLNRVLGRPKASPWDETEWLQSLQRLHEIIGPRIAAAGMPKMHAQDLQNSLCEWDKFERVRLGEGKPRSRYPGQAEPPVAPSQHDRDTAVASRPRRRKALQPVLKWHGAACAGL